jgi:hypothetical protein
MTHAERKRLLDRALAVITDPQADIAKMCDLLEAELAQQKLLEQAEEFLGAHPKKRKA